MIKHLPLLAGAAMLAFTSPALAHPGKGGGGGPNSHAKTHATTKGKGHSAVRGYTTHGKGSLYGYGTGGCPPGLAKKNNGCMPPGKVRKLYNVGQRYPGSYGSLWNYNQIPTDIRSQYDLSRSGRYYYGDGYLYQVDPRTRLIQQVVSALAR
ncbi:MAG: hypothetical protein ABIO80_06675 [Sphingomicrobium sp.]